MTNEILLEFFKQSLLVGLLAYGLRVFYLKDEQRRNLDLEERKALLDRVQKQEEKYEQYILKNEQVMQTLIRENNEVIEKQNQTMNRTNELTQCLIREMKEVKKMDWFKQYQNLKQPE